VGSSRISRTATDPAQIDPARELCITTLRFAPKDGVITTIPCEVYSKLPRLRNETKTAPISFEIG